MSKSKTKKIRVDYLARVEGEGGLYVEVSKGHVKKVQLNIFEPPRFFESLLEDKNYKLAADITSRICGICPVAYQVTAVQAFENLFNVDLSRRAQLLRRVLYCGEWIESHVLHSLMLHAPDFLGYPDAITLIQKQPEILKKALQLKKVGNDILKFIGGREIHPINIKVGGFYKEPDFLSDQYLQLMKDLESSLDIAIALLEWLSKFSYPKYSRDYLFFGLVHPDAYAIEKGQLTGTNKMTYQAEEFLNSFKEEQVPHSNALHCLYYENTNSKGREYLVGPLARWNLSHEKLPAEITQMAVKHGVSFYECNPFRSIQVRMFEVFFALMESKKLLDEIARGSESLDRSYKETMGVAYSLTEAPRGILFHKYNVDKSYKLNKVKIIPPTSQNQKSIEEDLRDVIIQNINLPDKQLKWLAEQTVRNYDPCISCATHFLKFEKREIDP